MAETKRKLATRVAVAGRWYGPGDDIPDDVAAQIRNPKAWASDMDTDAPQPEPGTSTGARLASRVQVDGRWYGPDDEVPDAVAARIKNPKAWAGGMPPGAAGTPAVKAAKPETAEDTPDAPGTGGLEGVVDGDSAGDTEPGATPDRQTRKGSTSKRS